MIKIERPPNFEAILAAFPGAADPGVIFAYGEDIYVPSATGGTIDIPAPLLAHEAAHGRRQLALEGSIIRTGRIELWWEKYIDDPEFRYREELLAHVAEYKVQVSRDRNANARLLMSTAKRLTAPLYQYSDKHSLSAAMRDLRWELER